eukprot:SAG31_NODE_572_length_13974_cov_28.935640_7_plen_246_part_00
MKEVAPPDDLLSRTVAIFGISPGAAVAAALGASAGCAAGDARPAQLAVAAALGASVGCAAGDVWPAQLAMAAALGASVGCLFRGCRSTTPGVPGPGAQADSGGGGESARSVAASGSGAPPALAQVTVGLGFCGTFCSFGGTFLVFMGLIEKYGTNRSGGSRPAGTGWKVYESERAVHEYLQFHYGAREEIVPYAFFGDRPADGLQFAQRLAAVCAKHARADRRETALDVVRRHQIKLNLNLNLNN